MRSVEELTALFRSRGLRVTPQRQAIFRALNTAAHHQTAERIYLAVSTELPTISLRTVYQALNDLSAMGELSALDLGTGATRFDPNLEPHHHLVCEVCGRIEDLHHEFSGVLLPAQVAARFTVSAAEIVFRGRCADCDQTRSIQHEKARAQHQLLSRPGLEAGTQRATRAGRHGHRSRAPRSSQ